MKQAVLEGIHRQINRELYSAYLYLAMSAWFEARSLEGFAGWMRAQATEERDHALRLFDHLIDRGVPVVLEAIDAPEADFGSALEVFEASLEHERQVTQWIHDLYDATLENHDHAAQVVLEWFVSEQVEEENSVGTIVDQLRMAGDNQAAVLMLDRELGSRSSAPSGGEA